MHPARSNRRAYVHGIQRDLDDLRYQENKVLGPLEQLQPDPADNPKGAVPENTREAEDGQNDLPNGPLGQLVDQIGEQQDGPHGEKGAPEADTAPHEDITAGYEVERGSEGGVHFDGGGGRGGAVWCCVGEMALLLLLLLLLGVLRGRRRRKLCAAKRLKIALRCCTGADEEECGGGGGAVVGGVEEESAADGGGWWLRRGLGEPPLAPQREYSERRQRHTSRPALQYAGQHTRKSDAAAALAMLAAVEEMLHVMFSAVALYG